jgi:hypothetical protein
MASYYMMNAMDSDFPTSKKGVKGGAVDTWYIDPETGKRIWNDGTQGKK